MPELLTFLDVETPNRRNDRICSIGIVRTDLAGSVIDRLSYLVDPEAPFDDINMKIHGIRPIDVKEAMSFGELWRNELSDVFRDTALIAHNASFDLAVLAKTMLAYDLGDDSGYAYACTRRMAQRLHPEFPSYKLPVVCRQLGIEMGTHHKAIADSDACMKVFWELYGELDDSRGVFETYEYRKPEHRREHRPQRFSQKTEALRFLMAILESVTKDGSLDFEECLAVLGFIDANQELLEDACIAEIADIMQQAASDGEIDAFESDQLNELISHLLHPTDGGAGRVTFEGRSFCLTGGFSHGSRDEVGAFIESKGGVILKGVTKKCDYVVIGEQGSEAYSMGSYGSKVRKALDWQAKGQPIQIVQERDLYE